MTTYSTYFSQELATTALDRFEPVGTAKNKQLIEDENPEDQLLVLSWSFPEVACYAAKLGLINIDLWKE